MGLLSKVWKEVKKGVKKTFDVIAPGIKKLWKNKVGRALIIGGLLVAGGFAAATMAGLWGGTASAAGSALGSGSALSTEAAIQGGIASEIGAAGSSTALAPGVIAQGGIASELGAGAIGSTSSAAMGSTAVGEAMAAGTGSAGGILGSAQSAAGALGSGLGKVGGFVAAHPEASMLVGGQMLSGAMQSKAQREALEDERRYQEGLRNGSTAWARRYDGTNEDQAIGADRLAAINQEYARGRNLLGAETPIRPSYTPRRRTRFNPQNNQWETA